MLELRVLKIMQVLLYSWRFFRYSAPTHWVIHGHMTSNNETARSENNETLRKL